MTHLISVAAFSLAKKPFRQNQDSILPPKKINNGYLFAVADGVGGYPGGELASNIVISHLNGINKESDLLNADNLFLSLKDKVFGLSEFNSELSKASTTLTYCYANDDGLHIGHIGDCRLYIKNKNKLIQLTKDHTQHQRLIDEGIYTKKELKGKSGSNLITTAISHAIEMNYDNFFIPKEKLHSDENIISLFIMSDGSHHFWEQRPRFSEQTMRDSIRFATSLRKRIETKIPSDDYSLIAVNLRLEN
ncbi:protein phosphatase [Erwinia sp. AG740]|nr:protein phosphatase [Erwinia sp. AG740]